MDPHLSHFWPEEIVHIATIHLVQWMVEIWFENSLTLPWKSFEQIWTIDYGIPMNSHDVDSFPTMQKYDWRGARFATEMLILLPGAALQLSKHQCCRSLPPSPLLSGHHNSTTNAAFHPHHHCCYITTIEPKTLPITTTTATIITALATTTYFTEWMK